MLIPANKIIKISFSHMKFIEYQRSNLISDHLFCWLQPNFCITWCQLGIRQLMHNHLAFTKQQDLCEIFVISIPFYEHIYMSYPLKLTHQYSHELQIHMVSICRSHPSATQSQGPVCSLIKQIQICKVNLTLF